jgi:AGZA family xanthine/uracil permease-like MFS transporter
MRARMRIGLWRVTLMKSITAYFEIEQRGSKVSREILAGMTTFAAMSYIVVVNPMILSSTGMDRSALLQATVISAVVGTLVMALWANLPIALAPGMGSNLVFSQVLVTQMGVSWKTGLALVFLNGVVFLLISLMRWREKIISAVPGTIKLGMQSSIGIFIAYLGLKNGGLVVADPQSFIAFAKLSDPAALLAFMGIILTPVLVVLRIPGAFLISIIGITVAGLFIHHPNGQAVTPRPEHFVGLPAMNPALLFAFDFREFFGKFLLLLPITLYFLLSEFFSGTATMLAIARRANLLTPSGELPNARAALSSDAISSIVGAAVGTSTVTTFVESVAGVEAGGRTGLSGIVVAALFALSIFLGPVLAIIPQQATAPALVLVGILMMEGLGELDLTRPESTLPPLAMLLFTVCTGDLLVGLSVGFFVYTFTVLALRQWRKITPMVIALDLVFVVFLILRNSIV